MQRYFTINPSAFTNLDRSVLYFVRIRPGVGQYRISVHGKRHDPIGRDFSNLDRDVPFLFRVRLGVGICRILLHGKSQDPIGRDLFWRVLDTSTECSFSL